MSTTIIIPDLHGDFDEFCNILYYYNIIKTRCPKYMIEILTNQSYIQNLDMYNKKLIQLGDILDSKSRISEKTDLIEYSDCILFVFLCDMKRYFPSNVVLISGNHELLNCKSIYTYVSANSQRENFIQKYIESNTANLFNYYYIDDNRYLYIHAPIPDDVRSIDDLNKYECTIKNISKLSTCEFVKLYDKLFKREYNNILQLDSLGIKKVFYGHIPHCKLKIINYRIYFVDNMISRSFVSYNNIYYCISIKNDKINIDGIERYLKYK